MLPLNLCLWIYLVRSEGVQKSLCIDTSLAEHIGNTRNGCLFSTWPLNHFAEHCMASFLSHHLKTKSFKCSNDSGGR